MNEARNPRLATSLKWGIGLAAAVVIAPVIYLAIKGLVGLAIAGVIGLGIINLAPVASMRLANLQLKGIKHEAQTNPIETLQNQFADRKRDFERMQQSVLEFNSAVRGFAQKVAGFKDRQPERAVEFETQLRGMRSLLALRSQKMSDAAAELTRFEIAIGQASDLWDMAQAAGAMNKLAGKRSEAFEKIKTDVAFDAVNQGLNRAFAELEMSLVEESPQALQTMSPSIRISAFVPAEKART